jgi:hypothetical protein
MSLPARQARAVRPKIAARNLGESLGWKRLNCRLCLRLVLK